MKKCIIKDLNSQSNNYVVRIVDPFNPTGSYKAVFDLLGYTFVYGPKTNAVVFKSYKEAERAIILYGKPNTKYLLEDVN